MKKRFSNEQIVAVLSRLERGEKAKDLCRELGISSPTLYAWKQKFGGLEVNDVKRLKDWVSTAQRLLISQSLSKTSPWLLG